MIIMYDINFAFIHSDDLHDVNSCMLQGKFTEQSSICGQKKVEIE